VEVKRRSSAEVDLVPYADAPSRMISLVRG
jgi:hypothetical protein